MIARLPFAACLLCLASLSCRSPQRPAAERSSFGMGEHVKAGPLIYTVLDSEWLDSLGDGAETRLPLRRFLAIRLSVVNSGNSTTSVPTMALEAPDGEQVLELTDASQLSDWLGGLRLIKPTDTEHGRVLFDVKPGAYRLRLAGENERGEETYAFVGIPYHIEPEIPRTEADGQPAGK